MVSRLRVALALGACALGAPAAAIAAPAAHPVASPPASATPLAVALDGSTSTADPGHALTAFAWDLGDGTTAAGPTVAHVYSGPGVYHVVLTVTDDAGATAAGAVDVTAAAVTLALSRPLVTYGGRVTATGTVVPPAAGAEVAIESGSRRLKTAHTTADGRFSVSFAPGSGALVVAHVTANGAISPPVALAVAPALQVVRSAVPAFVGGALTVRVAPASYRGRITATVSFHGRVVGRASARTRRGRAVIAVKAPGIGRLGVGIDVPAVAGLAARHLATSVLARGRTLTEGSRGADVAAFLHAIARVRIHVPGGSTLSADAVESVLAFQKAYRLARTGNVDTATWRALGTARLVKARYHMAGQHIEIDKSRQVLLVVRNGVLVGILPVSTGATGNTPSGHFHILWKAPSTTTWLGPAILWRTLTFFGGFAIHGFYPVPAYPASHGCVRIPIYAASWLYDQSPVGESVFLYG